MTGANPGHLSHWPDKSAFVLHCELERVAPVTARRAIKRFSTRRVSIAFGGMAATNSAISARLGRNPLRAAQRALLDVGEGMVRSRILMQLAKRRQTAFAQGMVFAAAPDLAASWVSNDAWLAHHRLELETDLIAAHLLVTGTVPAALFLG